MLLTEQAARLQDGDWAPFFAAECAKPYFAALDAFVTEAAAHTTVYPAAENIFAAFAACPAAGIRTVILGQDPYHEPGQAMGLSFSVPDGCKAPPSLRNIFKELEAELGPGCAAHTDLTLWARQGVLLLNTVLTVESGKANSHKSFGWQRFTDAVVASIAQLPQPVGFVLWGAQAQKKAAVCKVTEEKQLRKRLVVFCVAGKKLPAAVKVQQAACTGDRFAVANKDAEHGIRQNAKRFCSVMSRAVFRRRNGKKCAAFS